MTKFEKACEMSLNDWVDSLPDIIPEAEYTERHEKWLNNLYNKMRDNKYHVFTTKTVRLILIAAVLATILLTAFAIPSSREFTIENFDVFGTYKLTDSNNNSVNGKLKIGYIPEGFELVSEDAFSKSICYIFYDKQNRSISVCKYSSITEIDFDIEYTNQNEITIENVKYTYNIDSNGCSNVIWTKNDYIYVINGTLPEEELIKIAETIE